MKCRISAMCAISAMTMAASAGTPVSWDSVGGGTWNLPANWSPATVPGLTNTAVLGLTGAYTVTYDTTSSINGLMITNPDAQLDMPHGRTLTMFGAINNDGTIVLNSTGLAATTTIDFAASTMLDGTGRLMMTSLNTLSRVRTTGVGSVLTHGSSHTIEGRGRIEADMVNNGIIRANILGSELLMISDNKTNNATMEAVDGGIMDMSSITVTQGAAGELVGDGVDSQMELTNSTVVGGALMGINGGIIEINGTNTLDGVVFSGDMNMPHAAFLNIANSIENSGTIVLNSTGLAATTSIDFVDSGSFNGPGTVLMTSNASLSRIRTDPGMVMTNTSAHTIEGRGQILAAMINNGLVEANIAASELLVFTNDKTNNATMRAANGAIMDISGITLTQGAGGDLIASGAGSEIEFTNSTIIGGDVSTTAGGLIETNGTNTLDGVVFSGDMNMPHAAFLNIANSIENNGTIVLNSTGFAATTSIDFVDSGSFNGPGTVLMTSNASLSRIRTDPGMVMTNTSAHTIKGRGQILAAMINDGLVEANIAASELLVFTNDKTNNLMMRAVNGALMDVSGITLTQSATAQLVADGVGSQVEITNSTVDGGKMTAINGGFFEIQGSSHITDVDLLGTLNMPHATNLGVGFGTLNNGLIVVNSTLAAATTSFTFDEEIIVGGTGTIRLTRPNTLSRLVPGSGVTQGGLGTGQRLEGIGQIAIDLINHGTIAPGLSIGTMTATQPIFSSSAATFEVEVNATTADLLDSSSTIEVHGDLDVTLIDGFTPTAYWVRTVMEATDITGDFDTVNGPTAPVGLVFRHYNTGTEMLVGMTCKPDIDLSGGLNLQDVFGFLDLFNAQQPAADLAAPVGVFNLQDVFAYLASFNAGCP